MRQGDEGTKVSKYRLRSAEFRFIFFPVTARAAATYFLTSKFGSKTFFFLSNWVILLELIETLGNRSDFNSCESLAV